VGKFRELSECRGVGAGSCRDCRNLVCLKEQMRDPIRGGGKLGTRLGGRESDDRSIAYQLLEHARVSVRCLYLYISRLGWVEPGQSDHFFSLCVGMI